MTIQVIMFCAGFGASSLIWVIFLFAMDYWWHRRQQFAIEQVVQQIRHEVISSNFMAGNFSMTDTDEEMGH